MKTEIPPSIGEALKGFDEYQKQNSVSEAFEKFSETVNMLRDPSFRKRMDELREMDPFTKLFNNPSFKKGMGITVTQYQKQKLVFQDKLNKIKELLELEGCQIPGMDAFFYWFLEIKHKGKSIIEALISTPTEEDLFEYIKWRNKEKKPPTHREAMFAYNYRCEADKTLPAKNGVQWFNERGGRAKTEYSTTLPFHTTYTPPSDKEYDKIIAELKDDPKAQKIAESYKLAATQKTHS